MLAPVQQHVDEAIAHLPRRPQRPAVVALRPHATPTPESPVDRFRQADAEPLHPPSERLRPLGLDEQVYVVRLDREMHDAKGRGGGGCEATAQRPEEAHAPQRGETAHGPQRHMDRLAVVVEGPSPMGHAGPRPSRFAPRARAAATPGPERECALTGLKGHP